MHWKAACPLLYFAHMAYALPYFPLKPLRKRGILFLRDVLWFSVRAFGGPQQHLLLMRAQFVQKRGFISERELWELNALCQMLPGPTSTQTITAIGYKLGGPMLAFLTLLIWLLPASLVMLCLAIAHELMVEAGFNTHFLHFMQPLAVGFVAHAGYTISRAVCKTQVAWVVMGATAVLALAVRSPYLFPFVLIGGAAATNVFTKEPRDWPRPPRLKIWWGNLFLFGGVLGASAALGSLTRLRLVLLFENMYRFGSLVFGGGQVLVPLLFSQFVTYKHYLTEQEFLTGFSLAQAVPGPVFSFASYIGALTMKDMGLVGMVAGGLTGAVGIFLPGTFLIFFLFPIWNQIKNMPAVRNSIEGVNAVGAGLVVAAAVVLLQPIATQNVNVTVVGLVFVLLQFTKLPPWGLVLLGLGAGVVFP